MNITRIFAVLKDAETLLSVRYDRERYDQDHHTELNRIYALWTDPEYLFEFFVSQEHDLLSGFFEGVDVEDAVLTTLGEAKDLFTMLLQAAQAADGGDFSAFEVLFKPLDNGADPATPILALKAYGPDQPSWLRLFAIRLPGDVYAIVGGTIKLTPTLNTREHTAKELAKVRGATAYFTEMLDGRNFFALYDIID